MTLIWLVVVVLAVIVSIEGLAIVALAREVGLMSRRLPPAPALDAGDGPGIGEILPIVTVKTITGQERTLTGPQPERQILLFLSSRCKPCLELIGELPGIRLDWPTERVLPVVSGPRDELLAIGDQLGSADSFAWDEFGRAAEALGVRGSPFALVTDRTGRVEARGVVNTREMVSSLLTGQVREGHPGMWVAESDGAGRHDH